ncbi:MAG: ArsR family transcriptional regulator [Pirellulaceae bacterium]|nr:MAG: ArsR family transcriptional regulator [Pirellulaceae bacterium]
MTTATAPLEWLHTLADTTRVRLLRLLETNELSVSELCQILQSPQSTISRHLKVLTADGWAESRRDGTTHLYRANTAAWEKSRGELWEWVRQRIQAAVMEMDQQRLHHVLAVRRRSDAFFSSAADRWDQLRAGLFGAQFDAHVLAASLSSDDVVGELGCGSAPLAQLVAPYVARVYAIDNSPAMLQAASRNLQRFDNVHCVLNNLNAIDLPDATFHLAWLVLVLPYLEKPVEVLAEAARLLQRDGSLVIVDLLPHRGGPLYEEMGHLRHGVSQQVLQGWAAETQLRIGRFVPLPTASGASGPGLFCAVLKREA